MWMRMCVFSSDKCLAVFCAQIEFSFEAWVSIPQSTQDKTSAPVGAWVNTELGIFYALGCFDPDIGASSSSSSSSSSAMSTPTMCTWQFHLGIRKQEAGEQQAQNTMGKGLIDSGEEKKKKKKKRNWIGLDMMMMTMVISKLTCL